MPQDQIIVGFKIQSDGSLKAITKQAGETKKSFDKLKHSAGEVDRGIKGVAGATSNSTKAFAKQSQGMGGLVAAYATIAANAWAVTAAFGALKDAMDRTILFKGAEFLGAQTGQNLVGMAKGLQQVTDGMINFAEAQRQVAIVSAAGFGQEEIEAIGNAAKNASRALGRDMKDSLDRLTRGIIKAEPEVLDELGIILRLETATKKFAIANNKSVESLTTFERSQAVMNEVLEQAEKKFGKLGKSQELVNQFTLLQATATDALHGSLGAVAGVLQPIAGYLNENTTALKVLMLVLTGALLKQAVPILASFNDSILKWGTSATIAAAKTEAALARQTKAFLKASAVRKSHRLAATSAFDDLLVNLQKNKKITKGMEKLMLGPLKGDNLRKAMAKNIAASYTLALKQVQAGTAVKSGFFAGAATKADLARIKKNFINVNTDLTRLDQTFWQKRRDQVTLFSQTSRLAFKRMQAEAVKSFAAIGRSWSNTGSLIERRGLISGMAASFRLVNLQVASSTIGMTAFSAAMSRASIVARGLAASLGSLFGIATTLFIAFTIFDIAKGFFETETEKAYASALDEIAQSTKELSETAQTLVKTFKLLDESTPKTFTEAAEKSQILSNVFQQELSSIKKLSEVKAKARSAEEKIERKQLLAHKATMRWMDSEEAKTRLRKLGLTEQANLISAFQAGVKKPVVLDDASEAIRLMIQDSPKLTAMLDSINRSGKSTAGLKSLVASTRAIVDLGQNLSKEQATVFLDKWEALLIPAAKETKTLAGEMRGLEGLLNNVTKAFEKAQKTGINVSKFTPTLKALTEMGNSLDVILKSASKGDKSLILKDLLETSSKLGFELTDSLGKPVTTATTAFKAFYEAVNVSHKNLITFKDDIAKIKLGSKDTIAALKMENSLRKEEEKIATERLRTLQLLEVSNAKLSTSAKALLVIQHKQITFDKAQKAKFADLHNKKLIAAESLLALEKEFARVSRAVDLGSQGAAKLKKVEVGIIAAKNALELLKAQRSSLLVIDDEGNKRIEEETRLLELAHPKNLAGAWESATSTMISQQKDVHEAMRDGMVSGVKQISDGFIDMAMSLDFSARSFKNLAASFIKGMGEMIAKQLMFNAVSGALGVLGFASGAVTATSGALTAPAPTSAFQASRFAVGGVVDRPTVALFGEAGMTEAFVPLPDGRTIPVTMSGQGGATNNVSVTINMSSDGSSDEISSNEVGSVIALAVQKELVKQSRPGGLLNRSRRN